MQTKIGKKTKIFIILIIFLIIFVNDIFSQNLGLSAELEEDEIWLGESVRLTLYLEGSEEAISPQLSIRGVSVKPLGGTTRSSTSITSINGKVTKNIKKAYVYAYELRPSVAGSIKIPAISINVEGQSLTTREKILTVKIPEKSDDYRLLLNFNRKTVYLNEDCKLTLRFEFEKSLKSLSFSIPELEGIDFKAKSATGSGDKFQLTVNDEIIYFSQDKNNDYTFLVAELSFKPEKTGEIKIQNATASFSYLSGYKRVQDFFGRTQNQEVYRNTVIPSNMVSLTVKPYPKDSQPDDFFGLSGRNVIAEAEVKTTEANIGDPLTLTIKFSGLNNTDVRIPSLSNYLGKGFDIPETRSEAKVEGDTKTIIQTIRISDTSVDSIPSISFPFFNTDTEEYEYTSTEAIPVTIRETKVITAASVETPGRKDEQPEKIQTEKNMEGIYYNYSGKQLLKSQEISLERLKHSILILALLLIPVFCFLAVLLFTVILPRFKEQARLRLNRKKALSILKKAALSISGEAYLSKLAAFNRQLQDFLKLYGRPNDEKLIEPPLLIINGVLYGKYSVETEKLCNAALQVVEILEVEK